MMSEPESVENDILKILLFLKLMVIKGPRLSRQAICDLDRIFVTHNFCMSMVFQ